MTSPRLVFSRHTSSPSGRKISQQRLPAAAAKRYARCPRRIVLESPPRRFHKCTYISIFATASGRRWRNATPLRHNTKRHRDDYFAKAIQQHLKSPASNDAKPSRHISIAAVISKAQCFSTMPNIFIVAPLLFPFHSLTQNANFSSPPLYLFDFYHDAGARHIRAISPLLARRRACFINYHYYASCQLQLRLLRG